MEVLRITGVRVEELLEITHHSLVQYRLPTTGELVPLLQIVPVEDRRGETSGGLRRNWRMCFSTVIHRVRDHTGQVPLITAYDWHECVWLPPSPLLFQRRFGAGAPQDQP